jgi:hypothetical protein
VAGHPKAGAPAGLHHAARIGEVHDELAVEVNRIGLGSVNGDLPDSPVPGTDTILPITSRQMLYEEGHFLLTDPVSKFIPEFKNLKVFGVRIINYMD